MVHPAAGSVFSRLAPLACGGALALVVTAGEIVVVSVVVTAVRPIVNNQGPALGLREHLGLEQLARVALGVELSSHDSHGQDQQQKTYSLNSRHPRLGLA